MSGSSRIASTASLSPLTTLRMPAGSPASIISSASRIGTPGSRSDGFRMKALPQAIAGANFHIGIIAGKLNGVMPATTPRGWRIEYMSMPGPAPSVNSPFRRCGMPQANSDHLDAALDVALGVGDRSCRARGRGDRRGCPSRVSTRSRNLIMTRARRCGLVAAQAGCAALAFSTAWRSSAFEASATWPMTSPVIGWKTSANRPEVPGTSWPPMKCPIWRMAPSPCSVRVRLARDIACSIIDKSARL